MAESLYRRLGGAERIAAIIEDSIDRHAVNPILAPRFRGKDLPSLKHIGMRYFCAGATARKECSGREIRTLSAEIDISERELAALIDDLLAALQDHGVGPRETGEIVALLYSLTGEPCGFSATQA